MPGDPSPASANAMHTTMPTTRLILMSASMVRGCLREVDPKTQTRRIVKPQPTPIPADVWKDRRSGSDHWWPSSMAQSMVEIRDMGGLCPYGQPGDRLWVRETVAIGYSYDGNRHVCYRADGDVELHPDRKWTPSIHMPRWASRITLEITGVRVERLQEISEEDAKAEGVESTPRSAPDGSFERGVEHLSDFYHLWESLNGPGSWDANPMVWVISFKRVKP